MFSLILAESSLELVPQELKNHPSVISHARKLGKVPSKILLDNSNRWGLKGHRKCSRK
jgi:rRNA small subunit pseudouridine methyltransferase Nep1